jgi:hypothetical protein
MEFFHSLTRPFGSLIYRSRPHFRGRKRWALVWLPVRNLVPNWKLGVYLRIWIQGINITVVLLQLLPGIRLDSLHRYYVAFIFLRSTMLAIAGLAEDLYR